MAKSLIDGSKILEDVIRYKGKEQIMEVMTMTMTETMMEV